MMQADAVTWIGIAIKALAYGASLSAIGAVLVLAFLAGLSADGSAALRRTAVASALLAAVFTALRLPAQVSFLMGGMLQGSFDPAVLALVAQSPLGESIAVRLVGLMLICAVIWRSVPGLRVAVFGAVIAASSFTLRGHTLDEPRLLLGGLITLHMLCLAYWIGALAPLARAARLEPPAQAGLLARNFGRQALWVVFALVVAGGALLAMFGVTSPAGFTSPYGQGVALKLILFAGVLALAARNKLSLTPVLMAAEPSAAARLQRAIKWEAVLIATILIVTAIFTSLSAPPTLAAA